MQTPQQEKPWINRQTTDLGTDVARADQPWGRKEEHAGTDLQRALDRFRAAISWATVSGPDGSQPLETCFESANEPGIGWRDLRRIRPSQAPPEADPTAASRSAQPTALQALRIGAFQAESQPGGPVPLVVRELGPVKAGGVQGQRASRASRSFAALEAPEPDRAIGEGAVGRRRDRPPVCAAARFPHRRAVRAAGARRASAGASMLHSQGLPKAQGAAGPRTTADRRDVVWAPARRRFNKAVKRSRAWRRAAIFQPTHRRPGNTN